MKIGYARVSDPSQNLDRQTAALRAEGCEKVFADKASGKAITGRPQLEKAIDALGTGHTLVVAEWDRATRSAIDGMRIILRVADREALIKVLDRAYLDLTTPMGRGLLGLFSGLAEDERQRIVKRANEGRTIARNKGVKFGRKSKLTEHQKSKALERLAAGESARSIAPDYNVSHSTIVRLRA